MPLQINSAQHIIFKTYFFANTSFGHKLAFKKIKNKFIYIYHENINISILFFRTRKRYWKKLIKLMLVDQGL